MRGQTLAVIKSQDIAGIETLVLRGPLGGAIPVPREWTDRADPCGYTELGKQTPVLRVPCLLALAEMLEQIDHKGQKELDG